MTLRRLALAAALVLAATACTPVVSVRGNMVDADRIAEIEVGASTRDDVLAILGSPTTVGTLDDARWYYVGQLVERRAILEPRLIERKVVAITFDEQGRVSVIEELNANDGRAVDIVRQQTPTRGNKPTWFQELFGNIGRFNR